MTQQTPLAPTIDPTLMGYLRPILTAAVTRGFLYISAWLLGRGIAVPGLTDSQTATVVTGIIAFAMWAWGPLKAYSDHWVKVAQQSQINNSPSAGAPPAGGSSSSEA